MQNTQQKFEEIVTARAPLPQNEIERLSVLKALNILDTPFEPLLDSITRLAAHMCGTPIALITLIDEKRQWFKSNYGFEKLRETSREYAFCAHAMLNADLMEVTDATEDPRFKNNPLVTGYPAIRFYAGVPLRVTPAISLGTLCVIDRAPGYLTPDKRESLRRLAKVAVEALLVRDEMRIHSLI